MQTGQKQRAVAIINLMVGILIGVALVVLVEAGRAGFFIGEMAGFSACFLLMGWRIHRVFQVIE